MRIDILTLFPEMFAPLKESIIKRAVEDEKVEINIINIRDFATPPHYKCDDEPFGGGAGMVMMCEPLFKAIESVMTPDSKIIYMSPRGKVFNQKYAEDLSKHTHLILICGHYEGIDQRVIDYFHIEELSIGDYVLTGGELPAMVVADSVIRLLPNVINDDSKAEESFTNGLLEYNQYTRPADYRGMKVPDVLLSGNHKKIAKYRKDESIKITRKNRPDLLK
ncbi:MAG TPA: tRNA (guanosine(37)-N1)-methyltransferase TrmD [Candidatus Onthoplasma faecigallinarum]|nr:tRNA (guanosine(37)-N1)-methyltransferase TrmD [Candidatus Onthoplasma faecigallinarum]